MGQYKKVLSGKGSAKMYAEKVKMKAYSINKQSKDSVFITLFSTKEDLLDLHRTLHPEETFVTVDDIEPVTLKNVLVKDLYNDVAYMVGERLIILVEHQSTVCENMPLRLLIYLAREYERIVFVESQSGKIYKKKQIAIPRPEFYVVYSGKEVWEKDILRLSDAYLVEGKNWLELEAQVIKRDNLTVKGGKLDGYLYFIQKIYKYRESGKDEKDAISTAVDDCIKEGVLVDFLLEKRKELVDMLEREFILEDYGAVREEEGREEGRVEGDYKRVIAQIKRALDRGKGDDEIVEDYLVSWADLAEIKRLLDEYPDKTDVELAEMMVKELV